MRTKLTTIFLVAVGLLAVSVPLFAHHGNAVYDTNKTIVLRGTVTEWFWANPHCFLKVDAKDDSGTMQHWVIESGSAPAMSAEGWSKSTFKPGDEVTLNVTLPKNGRTIGRLKNGVVINGQPFRTKSGGDAAEARPAPEP